MLDADIAKCFDRIDHEALSQKLNTSPTIRRQIRAWLKAGVIDGRQLLETSEGTPQGGVISPLLANIALHGMENRILQAFPQKWKGKQRIQQPPSIIRYADDFVILHEDLTVVQGCQQIIAEWLKGMGLELKPSKTRLTHTLNKYEDNEPGFDFLGFNIRQFPAGEHTSGKNTNGTLLGFTTIITPSSEKQKVHHEQIVNIINAHKTASQMKLIEELNPIIRGWANYYSAVVSKDVYYHQDHLMYQKLRAWAKRRHPNKSGEWITKKYWRTIGGDNWVFATRQENNPPKKNSDILDQPLNQSIFGRRDTSVDEGWSKMSGFIVTLRLLKHGETPIVRHEKVKSDASPFNGNLIYWSKRRGEHPEVPKRVATLLKRQKGKCTHCGLYFREEDVLEVDHITPKSIGGKDEYKNLQLLHRHCHDVKTANDNNALKTRNGTSAKKSKAGSMQDKHQIIEEPYEVKISRTDLKPSMGGDSHA